MGFSARRKPWAIEERAARAARRWATPVAIRRQVNPVEATREAIDDGMAHWADHCATCHSNDGSGDTTVGRALFPPAPDMRGPSTQEMSDGELFYAIERGIPFTGMPAWGTGTAGGERASWELVRFIRHVPNLTAEELQRMEALNPKSPADAMHEMEIDDFLSGGKKTIR
jgi:mono/diheme cytochrome c family protein